MVFDVLTNWELIFAIFPGLVLFLYGIEHFSAEIQRVAGERFREALGRLTSNRLKGAFLGCIVTALIQSSTATTVIVVGLVNAGTLSFVQSLGIIFGANVGTTITAQLVAFKLTSFAPIFIVLGFLLGLVGGRYQFLGKPIFYFGLVFFSLNLISDGIIPLKNDPSVNSLFASLSSIPIAIIVGFVFTTLVQSSSVTSGIIVVLSEAGLIGLDQGIPLLLGAAIGTTTTALIASSKMSLHAKRAAYANLLFNVVGVILLLPFLVPFTSFIAGFGGSPGQQIANALTVFRSIFAVFFLFVLKPFKNLVEKIVPGEEEEILFQTRYLPDRLPDDNGEAFKLVEKELGYLLEIVDKLYDDSILMLKSQKITGFQRIVKMEALADFLDEKIEKKILEISHRKLGTEDARHMILLVRISNALEQLGDKGKDISSTIKNMWDSGTYLSSESRDELGTVYDRFNDNIAVLRRTFPSISKSESDSMVKNDEGLMELINTYYESHLKRLADKTDDSMFVEILSLIEAANSKTRDIRKLSEAYGGSVTSKTH
ncbi:MAG: Na/Pi cotransporter family protein [Candidatus Altiarchaeales archaeon]|nr:Na/Pi cotransporter family protein [Candidatus Altiarchaeales archaeon]MBD3415933.1 Na/Pi cotransporter family protein [Candidatus Altiarchaeales archaeon]